MKNKIYEIDFGGHFKTQLLIQDNIPVFIKGVNGFGEKVDPKTIKLELIERI